MLTKGAGAPISADAVPLLVVRGPGGAALFFTPAV